MEQSGHTLCELFEQLGLPSNHREIEAFIEHNRPLDPEVKLSEAPFWSDTQREFLRQQLCADADWAELVDQLNTRLR